MLYLPTWNVASILKLLWALHLKVDKLWIRWMHAYYIKSFFILDTSIPLDSSFLFKKILKYREKVVADDIWRNQLNQAQFNMQTIYFLMRPSIAKVFWRELVMNNVATPKAKFILWLALWGRLATKYRLRLFNFDVDPMCIFCHCLTESLNHLYFDCPIVHRAWEALLRWFGQPIWVGDLHVLIVPLSRLVKGKAPRRRLLKALIKEFVYMAWRNCQIFEGKSIDFTSLLQRVVQNVVGRSLMHKKLKAMYNSLLDYLVYWDYVVCLF